MAYACTTLGCAGRGACVAALYGGGRLFALCGYGAGLGCAYGWTGVYGCAVLYGCDGLYG